MGNWSDNGSFTIEIDLTLPTLTAVIMASNNPNNSYAKTGDVVTLTIESSEPLSTLSGTIDGKSTIVSGSGINWTLSRTMNGTETEGLLNFAISYSDLAGNLGNLVSNVTSGVKVTFDKTSPTPVISSSSSNPTNVSPVPFTVIFNENVTGFTLADISVSSGTKGDFQEINPMEYSFTVTISASATINVNIGANLCTDYSGNGNNAALQFTVVYDKNPPEVTSISFTQSSPTNATNIDATIQFNKNVIGFSIEDINVVNGTLSSFQNADNQTYNVVVTPLADGEVKLSIPYGVCTDSPGNLNLASSEYIILSDRTQPTISIITSTTSPTNSSTFAVTATVSEQVIDFTSSDIVISDASISDFQETSPGSNTYTFNVNPQVQGLIQFNVPANTFTDLAGNNNTASQQISIFYDATPPKPEISSTHTSPTNQTSIPISIDFGEVVTGFTVDDITVSGGTKSDFATTNNRIFTFNLNVSSPGGYTINVVAGVCSDIAGNSSLAATTPFSIVFDNSTPSLSSVDIVSNHTNNKWARVGRKVTLSFTANEQIKDVVTSIHGHNVIASTTDNLSWTASYTLTDEDDEGIISFSINYNDLASNPGPQVNNTIFGGTNVTFDKTKPVISNVGISTTNPSGIYAKPGDRVNVTFTVDDPNVTYNVIIRGVAATLEGGPLTWTAYRNMLVSDVEGFVTFNITATDLAGNVSTPATSTDNDSWVIFDKTPPVVSSVTVNSGVYKVGDVIVINILADDDLYTKGDALVNGKDHVIINNYDNTYKINYTVQSGDVEHSGVTTLPVAISLVDIAGNVSSTVNAAQVQPGTLTLDSSIPSILSVTSDAEEIGNLIIGSTLTFTVSPTIPELGLTVNPQSYNSKSLLWSTVDGTIYNATYTVEEGDNTQVIPLQLGDVTLTDPAGNVSAPEEYGGVNKTIYAIRPTARILGTTSLCFSPGHSIPITFELTGYPPFEIIYRVGAGANITIMATELTKNVNITGLSHGVHEVSLVKLTDSKGNFVETSIQNAVITVHQLPEVTLNITASPFKPDEPPIVLAPFASPANGVFSGIGVGTDGRFYPSIVNQDETITITYTYTDPVTGCVNLATDDVLVTSGGAAIINLASHYCQYSEPALISGSNPDPANIIGSFMVSAPVNTWVDNNDNSLTLYPQFMYEGTYQVTYAYEDGGSVYEITRNFLIDSVSTAITFTGLLDKYCENSTSSTLVAINLYPTGGSGHFSGPVGGFFSEPNSNQAQFVPSNLEPDQTYQVSYYYLSPMGCSSDTTTFSALVSSLPEVNFALNHNYNFIGAPVNLMENATPQGGNFSGIGIIDVSWLRPDLVTPGTTSNIKYSYTNTTTGCSNDITKSTIILRASEVIQGLSNEYCYSDEEIEISCVPNFNPSIVGNFFSTKEGAIIPTTDNHSLYSIPVAGKGIDTVFYRYYIEGTPYEVYKRVVIDSIGQVSITGLSPSYCNDNLQTILVGNNNEHGQGSGLFSYNGTPVALTNQGNSLAYYYPSQEQPGDYTVTYTYNSSITSCSSQIAENVTINPIPNVRFAISQSCTDMEDPVQFINNTISDDEVIAWYWNFNNQGVSEEFEPSFQFSTAGTKRVWLTATTVNNCSVTKDSTVIIGVVPKANFTWRNECLTQEETVFTSTSSDLNIDNYLWVFDDGTEIFGPTQNNVSYQFANLGQHSVKLVLTSTDGCKDSLTKEILIKPLIAVNEILNGYYFEDFEEGEGFWDARGLVENGYYSWDFGQPSGQVINYASSGSNAWFTVIDINDQKVEKSQVVSPCFDLQLLEKPMLKFNIWSHPEVGRDGAVLQYDLNGLNEWKNLGSVGDGINWFNSSTIQGQPGGQGQFVGWSGMKMTEWATARISLDAIKNEANVRFRIAYATDGNALNSFDGFAFDDVWLGSRKKEVLVEYFTNNTINQTISTNNYMQVIEANNSQDLRAIHYHTSSPVGDPLFSAYPSGPLAREFYYSIGSVPFALVNGIMPLNFANTTGNQAIIERESLKDPIFNLSINCAGSSSISINISATALDGYSGDDFSLHCAIVEKQLDISNAPNGAVTFYNVLRALLPNPGGIAMPSSMNTGQNFTNEISWNPTNLHSLSNARVVVFIQNNNTREIYQSGHYDLSNLTSNSTITSSFTVNLYPNPASNFVWIESPEIIEEIALIDVAGRILSVFYPKTREFNLEVSNLNNGVYLLRLRSNTGKVVKRLVKQ